VVAESLLNQRAKKKIERKRASNNDPNYVDIDDNAVTRWGLQLPVLSDAEALQPRFANPWSLSRLEDRWRLHNHWLQKFKDSLAGDFVEDAEDYARTCVDLQDAHGSDNAARLKQVGDAVLSAHFHGAADGQLFRA
jgi:hypothetical protein